MKQGISTSTFTTEYSALDTQRSVWNFVPTHLNPADAASRGLPSEQLTSSFWFTSPPFLLSVGQDELEKRPYTLVSPETDLELRPANITKTCQG